MLRERWDADELLIVPGPFPVRQDLLAPKCGPFQDKLKRPGFQAASQHVPVYRDRGAAACVVGMEVSHWVIALIPVHVDHHTVERADPRYDPEDNQLWAAGGPGF